MNRVPNQYILTWRTNVKIHKPRYIYIHTHSDFEIYIYKLDSLNGFFTEDINKYKNIKLYRSCDQTQ